MRNAKRRRAAVVLAMTSLAAACGGRDASPVWTETDSAGVHVVTSEEPTRTWVASDEPLLSLGTTDGTGPTQFFRVRDVKLLRDGRLAVANQGSESVRVFRMDGGLDLEFGEPGYGPADFTRLSRLGERGDSILTYDGGNDRIGVRSPDGTLARVFRLEWEGLGAVVTQVLGDSTILTSTGRMLGDWGEGSGALIDSALVSHYRYDGTLVDSLGRVPGRVALVVRSGIARTVLGAPFTTSSSYVPVDGGVCWVFGAAVEVRCLGAGGALWSIARVDVPPAPVTEEDIAQYWANVEDGKPNAYRAAQLRVRKSTVFPDAFPAFMALIADDQGRLWAERYERDDAVPRTWWIFEEGRAVAKATLPARFTLTDVKGDRLAGVRADDMGVEHVEVYAWTR